MSLVALGGDLYHCPKSSQHGTWCLDQSASICWLYLVAWPAGSGMAKPAGAVVALIKEKHAGWFDSKGKAGP